ncbi:MAG: GGDEF domain-containing protein [Planctomycetaceae bacterium]|nr:GGDEF domain-containing protein [Planctomycetaceae bacterium]MBT6484648.1 GGDEF domain-containing protein [Planctomycetaceae bacterium]MBT6494828.1 GGDEF domain-containing protein [Planctomycetaceae bacterium]
MSAYSQSNPELPDDGQQRSRARTHVGGVLVQVTLVIFTIEALIMCAFQLVKPDAHSWNDVFLDASVLALGSGVVLYLWVIRPLDRKLTATVEELRTAKARAEKLSQIDPLTGVLNRRTFFERFEREWERTNRGGMSLSCIMLDLDLFKQVNDTHGHPAGDAVLKRVAELLETHCRVNDDVCRYGGEEFCVLLPDTEQDEAATFATRMCAALEQASVSYAGKMIHVTASFGVAERNERMSNAAELVDAADQALLRAKQAGRNCVETAEPDWQSQPVGRRDRLLHTGHSVETGTA